MFSVQLNSKKYDIMVHLQCFKWWIFKNEERTDPWLKKLYASTLEVGSLQK